MSKWTRFMDMHSGGGLKEAVQYIYIEAPQSEAEVIFYNRFGHNPYRVSCTCCGDDYSVSEDESLEKITAFDRNCAYIYCLPDGTELTDGEYRKLPFQQRMECNKADRGYYAERGDPERSYAPYVPLDKYLASGEVLVIRADEIKPQERVGSLPEQGYVWID